MPPTDEPVPTEKPEPAKKNAPRFFARPEADVDVEALADAILAWMTEAKRDAGE